MLDDEFQEIVLGTDQICILIILAASLLNSAFKRIFQLIFEKKVDNSFTTL